MPKLSPTTLRVYNGVEAYWEKEKRSPSLKDLRPLVGIAISGLQYHLKILEKEGLIAPRRHGIPRDIYLTKPEAA